ncbi:hypothetical protein [Hwangdonia lutea]|uniref:Uncharacterized protein n=1 Tax=Hwangdonia lutea TaxID=3075823 RepID=A0AA97EKM5_9FLAO|nr:hypothetical protein [Hwangdonia sp. SCSIO 19198]WOD43164.1 hypothetical protein RNZ46_14325 [Hwangdonia sp. SCSIO 19198]
MATIHTVKSKDTIAQSYGAVNHNNYSTSCFEIHKNSMMNDFCPNNFSKSALKPILLY